MTKKKKPSSKQSTINHIEITLEIETGNLIHRKFDNKGDLLNFINENAQNPQKILDEISPKESKKKIAEQMGFYDTEDDGEEW